MRMFTEELSEDNGTVYLILAVIVAILSYFPALCAYRVWRYGWSYTALTVCRLLIQLTSLPFVIFGCALAMLAAGHTICPPLFALVGMSTFSLAPVEGEEPPFDILLIHAGIMGCMSVYAAALVCYDKGVAVLNGHIRSDQYASRHQPAELGRVPEFLLHFFELTGGWPGSLVAQRVMRHKVSKESYQSEFKTCVLAHILFSLGLVCLLYGYVVPSYFLTAFFGLKCFAYLPEKESRVNTSDDEAT